MSYNTTERQLQSRIRELHCVIRRWRAIALLLGTLLLACAIVVVLQYAKLP
jgi:hypothetical protein